MYCSTCGSSINDTLKYCKNCGVKLVKGDEKEDTPESILDNLLTALCFVAIFGFAFLVGLVAILLDKIIAHQIVVLIVVIYLIALFGICYMLLSQVPKLIDAKLNKKSEQDETIQPVQLYAKNTAQLEEQRESVMSITENTTRTLEKVAMERN